MACGAYKIEQKQDHDPKAQRGGEDHRISVAQQKAHEDLSIEILVMRRQRLDNGYIYIVTLRLIIANKNRQIPIVLPFPGDVVDLLIRLQLGGAARFKLSGCIDRLNGLADGVRGVVVVNRLDGGEHGSLR